MERIVARGNKADIAIKTPAVLIVIYTVLETYFGFQTGRIQRKEVLMKEIESCSFRTLVMLLTLSLVLAHPASPLFAAADLYPSKPVRLIVASSTGGATDNIGRLMATKLSERLGKQVIPENRGGAGGTIAAEQVMRAEPDGYTLLFTSTQVVQNPLLYKVEYDALQSFVPVAKMGSAPNILVVHPSLPVYSVKELIALAKQQPGKLLISSAGAGSFTHMGIAYFMSMAGIDMKMIHFKGGGPALVDTLGGHTQVLFTTVVSGVPQVKAGKLRALGCGGLTRSKLLPDVPTLSEAGLPGYEAYLWWAIFAPLGTPKAVADRLNKELAVIMNAEETKKIFEQEGASADLLIGAEMVRYIEAEKTKWAKVIKDGNIKGEE